MEESEVDEAEDCGVELNKYGHQSHVHLARVPVAEVVRNDPGDGLTLDLCLEVVTFDAAEHLPQPLGLDDVVHELRGQSLAQRAHLRGVG